MDLVAAWLLYPIVALAVCWGLGLLVQRAAGELPAALLLPVGMAALVCATQLTTYWDWSAELTLPLVVVLTVAGFWLGRGRLRPPLDPWGVAAAGAVFAVFAAPIVLSGAATFAGYTVLGDTSIHMIGADALLDVRARLLVAAAVLVRVQPRRATTGRAATRPAGRPRPARSRPSCTRTSRGRSRSSSRCWWR